MKFEEFYEIKFGIPEGKLPSFMYQVMCPFGTLSEEFYGSIRPTQAVHVYSVDHVSDLLGKYIKDNYHAGCAAVSVGLILDKGTTAEAVDEYIRGVRNIVTVGTGVVLTYKPGYENDTVGLRTVSALHRPADGDEVFKFAKDIELLRKQHLNDNSLNRNDVRFYAELFSGNLVNLQHLIDKYPHRFDRIIAPKAKDDDDEMGMNDYIKRIKAVAKSGGSHVREIKWLKTGVDITLGNCHVTFRQRPNSIKMEAHAQSIEGKPLHNVATAERTINEAITDFMAYEVYCAQTGFGHYDRSKRTQYNCREMMKWMSKLAKKYGLLYTTNLLDASNMHPAPNEYAEISWLDGEPAIRMNIEFLHAVFEFDHINRLPLHTISVYHNTCEKDAKVSMEMWLAEAHRKALNGE